MDCDPFEATTDFYSKCLMGGFGDNPNSVNAGAFFNPAAPGLPINIFTEKEQTVFQDIAEGKMTNGISVFLTTVDARAAQTATRTRTGGELRKFEKIPLFFMVLENPKANQTKVPWGLCAMAIDWFVPFFSPQHIIDDCAIKRLSITKNPPLNFANDALKKNCRAYLVAFELSGGFSSAPTRPS